MFVCAFQILSMGFDACYNVWVASAGQTLRAHGCNNVYLSVCFCLCVCLCGQKHSFKIRLPPAFIQKGSSTFVVITKIRIHSLNIYENKAARSPKLHVLCMANKIHSTFTTGFRSRWNIRVRAPNNTIVHSLISHENKAARSPKLHLSLPFAPFAPLIRNSGVLETRIIPRKSPSLSNPLITHLPFKIRLHVQ